MTTIVDLGSSQVRFGSAKIESPWIIPQYLISYSKINYFDKYSFNDYGISINADCTPALQNGQIYDIDQVERLLRVVSVATSSGQSADISQYISRLTSMAVQAIELSTQLPEVPNIPSSLLNKAEEFDPSGMQKIFIATPHNAEQKYRLCQSMFEKYSVNKIGFAEQSVMSLFSTGQVSGISVNLGHGQTTVSAVQNGYWISSQTISHSKLVCGEQVRKMMVNMLQQQHVYFGEDFESQYLTNCMKNFVSIGQADSKKDIKFALPDGQSFTVQQGIFQRLGEIYENPEYLGIHEPSVHKMLQTVTQNIPESNQGQIKQLHISGGMANIREIPESICRKYENLLDLKVSLSKRPEYDCFVGCQAVVQTAADNWFIDKKSFDEMGEALFDTQKQENGF